MAKQCQICGKKPQTGHRISHSNIKTKTRSFPNLQKLRALVKGKVGKIVVCTRCIRSGFVQKAA